jgi:hypothetical protein
MLGKPCPALTFYMNGTALQQNTWKNYSYCFQDGSMAIACYAFDVDAQIHNVFEVLSYLSVEFIGSEPIKLGVLDVVLVVYH